MNDTTQPLPSSETLDVLLGDFFRSEMPSPWPAFAGSGKRPLRLAPLAATSQEADSQQTLPFRPRLHTRRALPWSRLALVAGIALLLLGAWLLPSSKPVFAPATPGLTGGDDTALRKVPMPLPGGSVTPDRLPTMVPEGDEVEPNK